MPGLPTSSTGPVHKPANGGKPKKLVVLLHGLGADGNDLIGLAPYWAPLLPDAEFVSPDAPFPCDMAPYGRQWFSFQSRAPRAVLAGVRAAAPILDNFLDEALAARGLGDGAAGARRLLAGHDDVALCRAAPRESRRRRSSDYSGALVGAATAGGGTPLAPAGAAGAWRRRPGRAVRARWRSR